MSKSVTVRLSAESVAQLKELAHENFRSVAQTVEWLIHEYKIRNESAQEYCEREPFHSELLAALEDIKNKRNCKIYNTVDELFDDIS